MTEKLLLTVREAAELMGLGEKAVRTLIKNVPDFPRVQTTPHRVMIPRGRLMQWLGEQANNQADYAKYEEERD